MLRLHTQDIQVNKTLTNSYAIYVKSIPLVYNNEGHHAT